MHSGNAELIGFSTAGFLRGGNMLYNVVNILKFQMQGCYVMIPTFIWPQVTLFKG